MVVGVWKDAEGGGAQGQCEARIGKPQRPRQGITRAAMNFPPKGISDRTVFFFTRWRGGGNFTAGRGSQEHLIFRGICVASFLSSYCAYECCRYHAGLLGPPMQMQVSRI